MNIAEGKLPLSHIAILILAAGASSRMGGRDKLMQDAGGMPLLARVTDRAVATGLPVLVTLPDLDHPRADLVNADAVTLVGVPDWASGMSASIRAGVAALPDRTSAVMILPGDMPDLQTVDLLALTRAAHAAPDAIIRAASQDGIPGHPVIFPADLFPELRAVSGDQGGHSVVSAHKTRLHLVELPANRALCDLDTPEDWAAWRTQPK